MPNTDAGPDRPNLDVALFYARAGLPVFPCHPAKKRPLVDGGFKAASCDEELIRRWWGRFPAAIVGLPTGQASGRWVLDIDVARGKAGDDSLFLLTERHGELPLTHMALTASGGYHYYFALPADERVVTRSGVWPGIDVRGEGGYVIAPGSLGELGSWEWEASADPTDGVTLADAPRWLLDVVVERTAPPAPEQQQPTRPGRVVRQEVESALRAVDAGEYSVWVMVGMALHATGAPWGFDAWDAWSATWPSYPGGDVLRKKWATFNAERGAAVSIASVFALAKQSGWEPTVVRTEGPMPETPPLEVYADDLPAPAAAKQPLRVVGGTEHDPRPVIELRNGELPQAVDDAEHYLIAAGSEVYQHGTRLVRVGRWEHGLPDGDRPDKRHAVGRPQGAGVLVDVSPEWLSDRLTRAIRWRRWDARKEAWKTVDCPSKIASTLLSRAGEWRFPLLLGFSDSPTLDGDGRIVSRPGYDAESGLYLSNPPAIAPMETTDRYLAERGVEILSEAVETFPFVSEADRAACLAMILTTLLRRALPAAPICGVSANTPGTGKSKLVSVAAAIATGRKAGVVGIGSTPEELEKRVDSILISGDALVNFDNVDRAIKSDVLCQVATEETKKIRVMGLSKIVEAPTNVCILMTGNNLTLVGDLVRRVVLVNLDAKCERPELRRFDRDAVSYVLARRPELIHAALSISKAYLDAGCPDVGATPFGSFEAWDKMVRRPLMWAGCADPLRPAEAMREQDHELVGMREFLREWDLLGRGPLTAAELSELCRARVSQFGDGWTAEHPALQDAAIQVMGDFGKWGPRELGYRLRSMAGRLFDNRRVRKADKGKGGVQWVVERVGG